jgi:hypothetical protein
MRGASPKWQSAGSALVVARLAAALVLAMAALSGCRVGPMVADALREPFPDGALDTASDRPHYGDTRTDAVAADAGGPCDLLLQNCADPKRACLPVDDRPGSATCSEPGTGPASSPCASNLECDAREACVFVAESQLMQCATICNPAATVTGCAPRVACHLIPGFQAGFCVP